MQNPSKSSCMAYQKSVSQLMFNYWYFVTLFLTLFRGFCYFCRNARNLSKLFGIWQIFCHDSSCQNRAIVIKFQMHVGRFAKLKFKAKTLKAAACLPPKIQLESSYEHNIQLTAHLSVFGIYLYFLLIFLLLCFVNHRNCNGFQIMCFFFLALISYCCRRFFDFLIWFFIDSES